MRPSLRDTKPHKVTPGGFSRYLNAIEPDSTIYLPRTSTSTNDLIPTELTIFIKHIKLSRKCMKHVNQEITGDKYLRLKWNFNHYEQCIESPEILQQRNVKLEITTKHELHIDEDFLNNLQKNPVIFNLYAVSYSKEVLVSTAEFLIEDLLQIVNNKEIARIVFKNFTIDKYSSYVASMDIWYRFACNKKALKHLFNRWTFKNKHMTSEINFQEELKFQSKTFDHVPVTTSEIDNFTGSLLQVLNRNNVLKTSQINRSLEEKVRQLRYKVNCKQTLQKNGKNPQDLQEEFKPELAVTVVKVMFLDGSRSVVDQDVQQIYVEYAFLGQEGPEMETPFSMAKVAANEDIVFNFTKTFDIDIQKNYDTCRLLVELIKKDGVLRFVVISEPLESLERPIQTCQEIGYAEVRFGEVIQLEDNVDVYQYEILDFDNPIVVVGYITIKFEGILAMRKMVLSLIAS